MKGLGLRAEGFAKGLVLAASTLAVGALAQTPATQPPSPQPPPPTFRTEANYVRVDIYPTKDGAPVTDLAQADFEILEGGVPQKIEQFERVLVRGGIPQDLRREPNSVEEGRQAAQNPRARVFVVFLDINHVSIEGSHRIRQPLIDALDRLIGPDDLVAVMTPEMSARDITFARKTTTIAGFLTRHWTWGERNQMNSTDPQEDQYRACYPGLPPQTCSDGTVDDDRGVADEMIERRREKLTLDALHDMVAYLRGVREERKAVIAITDGWRLFQPHDQLARKLRCQIPSGPQVGVDPRTGRLSGKTPVTTFSGTNPDSCERDRTTLAYMNNDISFRLLLDEANAANTSFYPVDPRGLSAFDEPIAKPTTGFPAPGSTTIVPPTVDAAWLRSRIDSLRTIAEATDGLAIVDSNDLSRGFKRVVDDLSSYYLIGYYSNGKLDGRFHPISVRVKRPGVRVRARRGYMAATPAAMNRTSTAGATASPSEAAAAAAAHAVEAAIAPLAGYTHDVPLRLQVAAGWKPGDTASAAMWVVGEIGGVAVMGDSWTEGFDATATLTTLADATVGSGRLTVPRGSRTFRLAVTSSQPIAAGEYVLRVGARAGAASIPSREVARLTIPQAPEATGALFVRHGASTGNKDAPTADLRFRRNEQIRVEIPIASTDPLTARLLDRTGKPLAVPVTAAARDDADGSRWATAQLALAPLAPGDYAIEIAAGDRRMISGFRVVP
jgi:VWFA-related protein